MKIRKKLISASSNLLKLPCQVKLAKCFVSPRILHKTQNYGFARRNRKEKSTNSQTSKDTWNSQEEIAEKRWKEIEKQLDIFSETYLFPEFPDRAPKRHTPKHPIRFDKNNEYKIFDLTSLLSKADMSYKLTFMALYCVSSGLFTSNLYLMSQIGPMIAPAIKSLLYYFFGIRKGLNFLIAKKNLDYTIITGMYLKNGKQVRIKTIAEEKTLEIKDICLLLDHGPQKVVKSLNEVNMPLIVAGEQIYLLKIINPDIRYVDVFVSIILGVELNTK
ncbi:unnamed protein product [Moneuplotes crassus]|uniref:Uncharacterized protein n=1 Tax=Euplotes crassus TaxID=5936 RepID=A0AAD1UPZ2_EUPCR|nr:unnamed protein product [Moneuplotes crassus]